MAVVDIGGVHIVRLGESRCGRTDDRATWVLWSDSLVVTPSRKPRTRMPPISRMVSRIALYAAFGACALGLVPAAHSSPCDPDTMRMSPQPVLSCPGVEPAPQMLPPAAPIAAAPIAPPPAGPVDADAGASPNALPAPGQAPDVPPVFNADGSQNFGQGGFFGGIWDEFHSDFHNGVPADLVYGPAPAPPPQ